MWIAYMTPQAPMRCMRHTESIKILKMTPLGPYYVLTEYCGFVV